jgi:ADP-ribose pyrophosphatase
VEPVDEKHNPWLTLSYKRIYANQWIELTEYAVKNPNGNDGIYGVIDFKNFAIGIVTLDEQLNTYLVGQWRYPLKEYSWEITEGGGPVAIEPLESAKRELLEETGIVADDWKLIQEFYTSNSCTNEKAFIFLARGLHFKQASPDDTEELQVKKMPFNNFFNKVLNSEIKDSLTVVAAFKVKYLLDNNLI